MKSACPVSQSIPRHSRLTRNFPPSLLPLSPSRFPASRLGLHPRAIYESRATASCRPPRAFARIHARESPRIGAGWWDEDSGGYVHWHPDDAPARLHDAENGKSSSGPGRTFPGSRESPFANLARSRSSFIDRVRTRFEHRNRRARSIRNVSPPPSIPRKRVIVARLSATPITRVRYTRWSRWKRNPIGRLFRRNLNSRFAAACFNRVDEGRGISLRSG